MGEAEHDSRERAALDRFANDVRRRLAPWVVDLILYGSRARNTAAPWSDWDVLALVEGRDPDRESELAGLAFDYLLSDRINISVKWLPVAMRDLQLRVGAPFMRNVQRDGRSLWTRTTGS
jgi:predicted nucleotidyltransferase